MILEKIKNLGFVATGCITIVIVFIMIMTSCSGNKKSNDKDSDTINVQSAEVEDTTKVEKVRVYFDNSSSMEGYVSRGAIAKGNQFLNIVNSLGQDFVTDNRFEAQFCCVENGCTGVRKEIKFDDFANMIQNGNVAKGEDSPLVDIIKGIAENSTPGTLSVLFTDGILSGTNSEVRNSPERKFNINNIDLLKSKLRNSIIDNNLGVSVYRFGSIPFVGKYSYYNNDSNHKSCTRPLFAIVFGTKKNVLEFKNWVESSANKGFKAQNVLHISEKMPICEGLIVPLFGISEDGITCTREQVYKKTRSTFLELRLDTKLFAGIFEKGYDYGNLKDSIKVTINGSNLPDSAKNNDGYKRLVEYDSDGFFTINIPDSRLKSGKNILHVNIPYRLPEWLTLYKTEDDKKQYNDSTTFMIHKFIEGLVEGVSGNDAIDALFDQEVKINYKK